MNSKCASLEDTNFMGLRKSLYLCKGAKVIMNNNLNTSLGLYNSSPGEIIDILYEQGTDPNESIPK